MYHMEISWDHDVLDGCNNLCFNPTMLLRYSIFENEKELKNIEVLCYGMEPNHSSTFI